MRLRNEAIDKSYEYARTKSLEMVAAGSQYKKRSTNSFNATIVNQTTTIGGDGTAYYEFDVQATVNNTNLYYSMSSIDIQLPTTNFSFRQNNADDASKVTVTSYSSDYRIKFGKTEIIAPNELVFFQSEIFMDDVSQIIQANTCVSSPDLESVTIISGTYATNTVTTKQGLTVLSSSHDAIFSSGSALTASATQTIKFRPGFSVNAGATMTAHIVPICGTLKSALVDSSTLINGKELQINSKINIFPNPTKGIITVEVKGESFKYELYNILGILLKREESCYDLMQIDLSDYAIGSYLLKILKKDNTQQSFTIFKE